MPTYVRRRNPLAARTKRDDPLASFQAAWRIDRGMVGMTERMAAVLWTMKTFGRDARLTNDDIEDRYLVLNEADPVTFPMQKPQGIRSRRAQVEELGLVEECAEQKPNREGTPVTCWRVTDLGWG